MCLGQVVTTVLGQVVTTVTTLRQFAPMAQPASCVLKMTERTQFNEANDFLVHLASGCVALDGNLVQSCYF